MGFFKNIVSALGGRDSGGTSSPQTAASSGSGGANAYRNTANTNKSNTNTNNARGFWTSLLSSVLGNSGASNTTNSASNKHTAPNTTNNTSNKHTAPNTVNNKNPQSYYVTHDEQGRAQGTILTKDQFEHDPVMPRYYGGNYDAYVRAQGQKSQSMQNAVDRTNQQRQEAGLSSNWTAEDVRTHDMVLNNMAMSGTGPLTKEDRLGVSDRYGKAALNFNNAKDPNPGQTTEEAIDAYLSGASGDLTWEQAKAENPLLTDRTLMRYYGDEKTSGYLEDNPGLVSIDIDEATIIAQAEAQARAQARAAHALKLKSSPTYIAKDYDEYVDLINQGLIAPRVVFDTTGNQVTVPYGASMEDYNTYLQNRYANNGDDYYNRSYNEMYDYDREFYEGNPEAYDADGNPVDPNTYLWLLNNPLTRALMQGITIPGESPGAGPSLQQIVQEPSVGGYGLRSEADVANMFAGHVLAGDELGVMLENDPVLLGAILNQAYTPRVDPNKPVTYNKDTRTGTLNLAEGYKTPAQLAAEVVSDPSNMPGMTNLQLLAAANEYNKGAITPENPEDSGSGGPGGGGYGGGSMPAGGNPETNDTLYSMPEVGNYAAQMILNRMLPTGYDYNYNKRLDKRLADIAAAEQNYKGSVLPSVERTYQDQAANTMANLVAALRANRASGLTSGASRGAQAASDVQAVQAASKENSESLNKLINENLASFLTQLAGKRATAGNDTASELQGYASPMMTALGEVLAQYNYGSAAAQVNNGGLRRMQSYLV